MGISKIAASLPKTMTAYASRQAVLGGYEVSVSLRSVNSKYLDLNVFFYPDSLSVHLEQHIRDSLAKFVCRGRVEVKISVQPAYNSFGWEKGRDLKQYVAKLRRLKRDLGLQPDLSLNEALSLYYNYQAKQQKRINISHLKIQRLFQQALNAYESFRVKQARAILADIRRDLLAIKTEIKKLSRILSKDPQVYPPEEAKGVNEEIVLLLFYIEEVFSLLQRRQGRIGKLLDFFSQEMLREVNTILAKIKNRRACVLLVYSKEAIERIREHSQNLE